MTTTQTIHVTATQQFQSLKQLAPKLRTEPVSERIKRLQSLRTWIHQNRAAIHKAMHDDFSKAPAEVDAIEIFHVLNEINEAVNNLDVWSAPRKIDAPITMLGTRSWVYYEPRGVCLIISPWNYPFSLSVGPLVSAIAAGNCVVLKPSEHTAHVSALLKKLISDIRLDDIVKVVEGDADVSRELLRLPFDHIFFTGSPAVGKIVMKAAAEHLTSVTLELGGKSPTIVTESANLNDAAERIAVAKFVNNGQTCIAPDYIVVHQRVAARFVSLLIDKIKYRFARDTDFIKSPDYCRIVNNNHFDRLAMLLKDALDKGAKLEYSGNADAPSRFFHPIVLTNVAQDSQLMEHEIFGPILPVLTYDNLDEAIRLINEKPKPLALYLYTTSRKEKKRVLSETSSGGVCINDSGIHFLHHNLPFGGVNNSGIGKSHGYSGFIAFSNEKAVLQQKSGFTSVKLFYPPYTKFSRTIMDWFLKFF
jgi:aldehyde dehydrogenase (NAD+)